MPVASESQNSQTATITTEHSLAAPTTAGVRVLVVDMINMAAGDVVELRIKLATLTAGTQRVVYMATFMDAQHVDDLIKVSLPIASEQGATFTLKQTVGTGRVFPWKILTL